MTIQSRPVPAAQSRSVPAAQSRPIPAAGPDRGSDREADGRRLDALEGRALALSARRAEILARDRELRGEVGLAKGRLELRPRVEAVLQRLQERAHERSVGVYERLLTGLVGDVLPGDRRVVLELGTERGLPALEVEVERGGHREGIVDGSGGSLTNVVSAGLRFAALVRSGRRRFIALDEPDCWLAPDRVPAFCGVVATVAREVGVQTLLVSHHDPALFASDALVLRLDDGGAAGPVIEPGSPRPEWPAEWPEERPGIRAVRLVDFMSHRDTRVPLGPGVTALVGPNNLGKSAVVAALRACAYGLGPETTIRHGAPAARVEVEVEGGRTVVWERRRRGAPRVTWRLLGPGGEVEVETPGAREVPGWAAATLGIAPVDEIDVQLGHQKRPVFLLDQPARQRAQILSVGRESGHLMGMIERHRDAVRRDAERVRRGEAELQALADRLAGFAGLEGADAALRAARRDLDRIRAGEAEAAGIEALLARLDAAARRAGALAAGLGSAPPLPAPPAMEPTAAEDAAARRIEALAAAVGRARAALDPLDALPAEPPGVAPTGALAAVLDRLGDVPPAAFLNPAFPALPEAPVPEAAAGLAAVAARLAALGEAVARDGAALDEAAAGIAAAEAAVGDLLGRLDHHCPLCGQAVAGAAHILGTRHGRGRHGG